MQSQYSAVNVDQAGRVAHTIIICNDQQKSKQQFSMCRLVASIKPGAVSVFGHSSVCI